MQQLQNDAGLRHRAYQSNSLLRFLQILSSFLKHRKRSELLRELAAFSRRKCSSVSGDRKRVKILSADPDMTGCVDVTLLEPDSSIQIYIGEKFSGRIEAQVRGRNSTLFIGNNCSLDGLTVFSFQDDDEIIIGDRVTISTAQKNRPDKVRLFSGGHSLNCPFLIIGDDCMFSFGVTVRTTDAHPVISTETQDQVNVSKRGVVLEPHVWIGQDAAILKDVTVGACLIVALGAVVVKDVPRSSLVAGVPASSRPLRDKLWVRSSNRTARAEAQRFQERYCDDSVDRD